MSGTPASVFRYGVRVVATAAALLVVVAGAAVWLLVTDPVNVANTLTAGEAAPFLREVAVVLYGALLALLRFL